MRFNGFLGGLFGKKAQRDEQTIPAGESPSIPLTPADIARQERQRQAAATHEGVFNADFARVLDRADAGWKAPGSSNCDPLAYLGNLEPLGLSAEERLIVREWTRELIEEKGPEAVWDSRIRLKLELRYLITESGRRKGPGRFQGEGRA